MTNLVLHPKTSADIYDFASAMIDEGFWKPGRRNKKSQADHKRVIGLCKVASQLDWQIVCAKKEGRDPAPYIAALSAACLHIAELGQTALANGLLNPGTHDPYILENPAVCDEANR